MGGSKKGIKGIILPSSVGTILNHYKDPYSTTSISWKVRGLFSWLIWFPSWIEDWRREQCPGWFKWLFFWGDVRQRSFFVKSILQRNISKSQCFFSKHVEHYAMWQCNSVSCAFSMGLSASRMFHQTSRWWGLTSSPSCLRSCWRTPLHFYGSN